YVPLLCCVLVSSLQLFPAALLDLSGAAQVKGEWMGSTTLPCTYTPSEGFTQKTLTWSLERDFTTSTIFRRDDSGDHVLLSRFRDRVSVPKHNPGDASLQITDLQIPDSGHYTCQIIWRSENYSLITKEVTTTVKVIKVAVTKPTIVAGALGLAVPVGANASLTCVAHGSPPISYRWFRAAPGRTGQLLSSEAELVWSSLQPSDAGTYYCEAQNRVSAGTVQRSDAVELTVRDLPTAAVTPESTVGYPGKDEATQSFNMLQIQLDSILERKVVCFFSYDMHCTLLPCSQLQPQHSAGGLAVTNTPTQSQMGSQRTHLYLVILIAVLGGAVVFLVIFAIACARKPKHDVIRMDTGVEVPDKCRKEKKNSETEESYETVTMACNNYESMTGNNYESVCLSENAESETLVNAMESEYEVRDLQ
ncbi:UNVERIFIED_CONTAM: hypothetical protein H355_010954, partial [Colinus virginianus]